MSTKTFNLTYYHKETKQVLKAYKVTHYQYMIQDSTTGEGVPMTGHELFKNYIPDKKNRGAVMRVIKKRGPQTLTKEFKEYLKRSGGESTSAY